MPGATGRKCLRQLLSMEPLAATPEEIKEWRATGHGGRHFLVTAARAFEARSAVLDELGRWAGPRRQAPSLAASTGGGAMAARYSEEVGDAIFASARCCLVAALRVLCASVDWSRDLTRGPDGGSLLTLDGAPASRSIGWDPTAAGRSSRRHSQIAPTAAAAAAPQLRSRALWATRSGPHALGREL
ncbi:hypothetical protein T492DRAFT_883781 [Pavlovales sp. CCMP2436]|nr:hypothetical protein T492DRAFT_883781 [Pavlovales sp. CCMP2436]